MHIGLARLPAQEVNRGATIATAGFAFLFRAELVSQDKSCQTVAQCSLSNDDHQQVSANLISMSVSSTHSEDVPKISLYKATTRETTREASGDNNSGPRRWRWETCPQRDRRHNLPSAMMPPYPQRDQTHETAKLQPMTLFPSLLFLRLPFIGSNVPPEQARLQLFWHTSSLT